MELLSKLRKQLGNRKITEGLNVGQFFLQEGKREDLILEELQKDVLDALKGKGKWETYTDEKTGESAEFRFATNKYQVESSSVEDLVSQELEPLINRKRKEPVKRIRMTLKNYNLFITNIWL